MLLPKCQCLRLLLGERSIVLRFSYSINGCQLGKLQITLLAGMLVVAVFAKAGALSFMTLDNPDAPVFAGYGTRIFGINESGEMVGSYLNASFYTASFTYSNGVFASLNYPSAIETDVSRINNAGQISGSYYDGHQNHGFLNSGNSWTSIDFPGRSEERRVGKE